MATRDLGKLYDDLTQEDRQALFLKLFDGVVGHPVPLGDAEGTVLVGVKSDRDVNPGETIAVCYVNQFEEFQARRLVILEPVVERVDVVRFTKEVPEFREETQGYLWWRKRVKVQTGMKIVPYEESRKVRMEAVPRGAWSVEHCYFGAIQFAHLGTISGDAFGPGNEMDFRGNVVPVGLPVSFMVRHSCLQAVPFRAVFLGTRADKKSAFFPRNVA